MSNQIIGKQKPLGRREKPCDDIGTHVMNAIRRIEYKKRCTLNKPKNYLKEQKGLHDGSNSSIIKAKFNPVKERGKLKEAEKRYKTSVSEKDDSKLKEKQIAKKQVNTIQTTKPPNRNIKILVMNAVKKLQGKGCTLGNIKYYLASKDVDIKSNLGKINSEVSKAMKNGSLIRREKKYIIPSLEKANPFNAKINIKNTKNAEKTNTRNVVKTGVKIPIGNAKAEENMMEITNQEQTNDKQLQDKHLSKSTEMILPKKNDQQISVPDKKLHRVITKKQKNAIQTLNPRRSIKILVMNAIKKFQGKGCTLTDLKYYLEKEKGVDIKSNSEAIKSAINTAIKKGSLIKHEQKYCIPSLKINIENNESGKNANSKNFTGTKTVIGNFIAEENMIKMTNHLQTNAKQLQDMNLTMINTEITVPWKNDQQISIPDTKSHKQITKKLQNTTQTLNPHRNIKILVMNAIKKLQEKGFSLTNLKYYLEKEKGVDIKSNLEAINSGINTAMKKGSLIRHDGKYKIPPIQNSNKTNVESVMTINGNTDIGIVSSNNNVNNATNHVNSDELHEVNVAGTSENLNIDENMRSYGEKNEESPQVETTSALNGRIHGFFSPLQVRENLEVNVDSVNDGIISGSLNQEKDKKSVHFKASIINPLKEPFDALSNTSSKTLSKKIAPHRSKKAHPKRRKKYTPIIHRFIPFVYF